MATWDDLPSEIVQYILQLRYEMMHDRWEEYMDQMERQYLARWEMDREMDEPQYIVEYDMWVE